MVAGADLPIAADQEVTGLFTLHPLLKELANGGALGNLDVIGESGSEIVDEKDLHDRNLPLLNA